MTKPGSTKLKCPYCDGHIEAPNELLGNWTNCPHCAKEIPLETPVDLPAGFISKAANQTPLTTKQSSDGKKRKLNWWLIAPVIGVAMFVGFLLFAGEPQNAFLNKLGLAGFGTLGLVIGGILFALALFWAVCLFLLPIVVYFIYRTLLKIERNTRPNIAEGLSLKTRQPHPPA